uniref:H/ACA ribonucleoprotein complex non-core subunit NAF1 n=1 Tax=Pogona vitticeps TaxID=103695 RepID=A0A6J0UY55_9SAUR
MEEMEGVSGAPLQGDVGLTGLKVLEHLQTLKVACEGTCPPGLAWEEGASCPPPEGRSAASPPEGLPMLPEAALHGGDGEERLPLLGAGDAAMEEEPPLLGSRRPSSERGWTWPALNSEAGVEPVPGFGEGGPETPAGGAQEVKEELPPPPPNSCGGSSSLLVSDGDLTQGELAGKSASQTSEKLPEAVPAAPGKETEESAVGSSGSTASSSESESESESDTDTDSSSSVSSSSSCLPSLSEDDEQQCKKEKNSGNTRKKGESTEKDSPNIEELTIILPESVELMPFGKVSSIIEHQVIIESEKGLPPVNEDTVFFKDDHHSIGKVFEVFGPVSHPFYVLQFNSPEHIESKGIKIHDAVYFAPSVESFTQYIFPEKLKQERGSDASWKNDEEPPPEVLDFSDDEKERAAKQQKKSQNIRRKKFRQDYNENGSNCQPRQHPSDYFGGYCRGEPNPRFSRGRFPQSSVPPRFFRHPARTPQHYPDYTEPKKPSSFYQQRRQDSSWRHQYSFPPPSFETVNNEANFPPPPPPVTWGWSRGCSQNIYDPLFSLLSLPPPPPPPLPPPSAATSSKSMNPP